jgi:uncharacterized membrane protein
MIFTLDYFFILLGLMLSVIAVMSFLDQANPRRLTTGLFWALYAAVYLVGERLPPALVGSIVIVMAVIAGFGGVALGKYGELSAQQRRSSAQKLGNRLFIPALIIPVATMIGSVVFKNVKIGDMFLLDQKNFTLVSLGFGCILALLAACWITRATPVQSMREARRLIDSMGWAVVLPHMLAVLGLLFSDAGVGKAVAHLTTSYINMDYRLVAVVVYCVGMALFTVIMGNGFAAFPVMAGGVGIPVLVGVYHANPAVMAAIGMFSGYCGTLMTPMAANYNIVPAALLGLPDKNGVIKAQIPTALTLLLVNIFLMYFLMMR